MKPAVMTKARCCVTTAVLIPVTVVRIAAAVQVKADKCALEIRCVATDVAKPIAPKPRKPGAVTPVRTWKTIAKTVARVGWRVALGLAVWEAYARVLSPW